MMKMKVMVEIKIQTPKMRTGTSNMMLPVKILIMQLLKRNLMILNQKLKNLLNKFQLFQLRNKSQIITWKEYQTMKAKITTAMFLIEEISLILVTFHK